MKKIYIIILLIVIPSSIQAQIQPRTQNVNVKAEVKQDITVKDEAAIQKQDFLESQAAGAAVAALILKKNKNKYEEAELMYEVEPSVENAFELAGYAKKLFGAGLREDRFGPITKEHKILIVKFKGNYKKYKKKNK
tara:strand:- start:368 stop:775 length:408 start_codon:yes stop_codon:yes gene_type:complete